MEETITFMQLSLCACSSINQIYSSLHQPDTEKVMAGETDGLEDPYEEVWRKNIGA